MKKTFGKIAIVLLAVLLVYIMFGNVVITYNNRELRKSITSITEEKVYFNDVVPFDWDVVYTFSPYTSKEEIEETIGFTSGAIIESTNEGMLQLLFVKDEKVVASVCGYIDGLGYDVVFSEQIRKEENKVFEVKEEDGIVKLY